MDIVVQLFGEFVIRIDRITYNKFRTTKVQALLAFLIVEYAHPVRREQLYDLLWPGLPLQSAQVNLRQTLYQARKVLSKAHEAPIVSERGMLQLNPELPLSADIHHFDQNLLENADHDHFDLVTCRPCQQRLAQAVDLYAGPLLANVYLDDSDVFEEWIRNHRTAYERDQLEALTTLTTIYLHSGQYQAAEAAALRQLSYDNLREEAHQQLMEALVLSGRRTQALRQYDVCRHLLQDELGILPSTAIEELNEAIRSSVYQGVAVGRVTPVTIDPESASKLPHHNLPAQATPFIGRIKELMALDTLLGQSRIVSIVGLGGMGKTRLALACAARQLALANQADARFSDGVFFAALVAVDNPEHIAAVIAEAVGFQFQGDASRSEMQQLLDYLANKQMLIVLDNFEQLIASVGMLEELIRLAPGVTLLVTSREKLRARGEQLFMLDGLDSDTEATGEAIGQTPAGQLFVRSARRIRRDFALDQPEDEAYLREVCQLVGGMPLALELSAGWVDMLSRADIVAELRAGIDILDSDLDTAEQRQGSIRAVFDATFERLDSAEKEIIAQLSIFRGGFTRKAAHTVTGASFRQLAQLNNKSLISYRRRLDRYEIHELWRQYGAERLRADAASQHAARDRHSAFYCHFLEQHSEKWHTKEQLQTLAAVTRDLENSRRALRWALQQEDWQRILAAMDSWGWYREWQGSSAEQTSFFQAVVEQAAHERD